MSAIAIVDCGLRIVDCELRIVDCVNCRTLDNLRHNAQSAIRYRENPYSEAITTPN